MQGTEHLCLARAKMGKVVMFVSIKWILWGFQDLSILFVENKSGDDSPSSVFYEAIEQTINH
jgi:hypothetical protein